MSKFLLFLSVLFCTAITAQDNDPRSIDLPGFDRIGNFFKTRDEILPAELSMDLEDMRKLSVGKTKPPKLIEEVQGDHIIAKVYVDAKLVLSQSFNKKGVLDGMAIVYYANGKVKQEMSFLNGMANGAAKTYDDDGFLKVETTYKNNELHGLRKVNAQRGGGIEGSFDNGKVKGKIKVQDSKGVVYYYPPDMKTGVVEVYYGAIKAAEIPIIAEETAHGEQKEFTKDGKLKNVFRFQNGKRHGFSEYYKSDGTLLYSNNYNNGEHIGKYISMLENGVVVTEGYYDDSGAKMGLWVLRDKSGQRTHEIEYKNGKLHGTYKSFSNGVVREETSYLDGKKDGVSKLYDKETGALSSEKNYKDDETVSYKSYYQDGKLHAAFSTNADKTSSTVYYDHEGKIINESKYNHKRQPVGVHMLIMMEGNSYRISNVNTFDDSGKLLKKVVYGQGGNYIEITHDGEIKHGPRADYDAGTNQKTVTYYFKDKLVSEKEFNELTAKKKP